jgi:hypothetical protein
MKYMISKKIPHQFFEYRKDKLIYLTIHLRDFLHIFNLHFYFSVGVYDNRNEHVLDARNLILNRRGLGAVWMEER